jgi:hypothetical protein
MLIHEQLAAECIDEQFAYLGKHDWGTLGALVDVTIVGSTRPGCRQPAA